MVIEFSVGCAELIRWTICTKSSYLSTWLWSWPTSGESKITVWRIFWNFFWWVRHSLFEDKVHSTTPLLQTSAIPLIVKMMKKTTFLPTTEKIDITHALVARLITAQFPQWADLPIKPVEFDGWDNRTFHLGADMTIRLPSSQEYSQQVIKEHDWLPKLSPHLPQQIPMPLAMGKPGWACWSS